MRTNKHYTYFYKYLLSYTVIILIPIVILGGLFQLQLKKSLTKQVDANTQKQLMTMQSSLDSEILKLNSIVNQLQYNSSVKFFKFNEDPLYARQVSKSLLQYKATNFFIEDLMIYFIAEHHLYTSQGSLTTDIFINSIYDYANWDEESFYHDINNIDLSYFRNTEEVTTFDGKVKNYVTYLYPLTKEGFNNYATVMFLIPEDSIRTLIDYTYNTQDNNVIVMNSYGKIVTASEDADYIDTQAFKDITKSIDGITSTTISLEGNQYVVTSLKSPETGWSYMAITSIRNALKPIMTLQFQLLLGIIVILIIGVIIIFVLSTLNYRPIRNLRKLADSINPNSNNPKRTNELEYIGKTLESLHKRNDTLNKKLGNSKVASKEYAIQQLLAGKINWRYEEDLETLNNIINIEHKQFFVAIIHMTSPLDYWEDHKQKIITCMEEQSDEHLIFLGKEDTLGTQLTLIGSVIDLSYEDIQHKILILQKHLMDAWELDTTIGVGKSYPSIAQLPLSYMEASTAIDYRLILGNGGIINFDAITQNINTANIYPYEDIKLYKLALKKGDAEKVHLILQKIVQGIQTSNIPLFQVKSVCFEIISIAINTSKQHSQFNSHLDNYPDIFTLTRYESIDAIVEVVKQISQDICNDLFDNNPHRSSHKELQDYIVVHFKDFDAYKMADHFNMPLPQLRSTYKNHSGETIFQSITKLKMIEAKELLIKSPQLSINNISVEVGYDNVSSFIRRFKQIYGVTPGQFRELNVDNSEA